jgi:hypothetical protein
MLWVESKEGENYLSVRDYSLYNEHNKLTSYTMVQLILVQYIEGVDEVLSEKEKRERRGVQRNPL